MDQPGNATRSSTFKLGQIPRETDRYGAPSRKRTCCKLRSVMRQRTIHVGPLCSVTAVAGACIVTAKMVADPSGAVIHLVTTQVDFMGSSAPAGMFCFVVQKSTSVARISPVCKHNRRESTSEECAGRTLLATTTKACTTGASGEEGLLFSRDLGSPKEGSWRKKSSAKKQVSGTW